MRSLFNSIEDYCKLGHGSALTLAGVATPLAAHDALIV